jgi:O-antigen ligase
MAMNLTLLYAAALTLGLVGVRRIADLTGLAWAALAGAAIVTAHALGTRLLPDVIGGDARPRLAEPLSYWNGLGALVAFGAVLAIGMAGNPRQHPAARAAAAGLAPMFLLALLLTYSRGAVLVLIVALVLLVAVSPARLETFAALLLAVLVSVPLLIGANGDDAIAGLSGSLPPHGDEGRHHLLVLLGTMAVAAALSLGAAFVARRLTGPPRRVAGAVLAIGAVGLAAALLVVKMPDEGPVTWTQDQFDAFKTYDTAARADAESVADRLVVAAGSGRWQNWTAAVEQFQAAPVSGTGAGDYAFWWQQHRDIDLAVQNAHSVYLEVLAETGVVGLLLLLVPVGAVAISLARFLPRSHADAPTVVVAVAAVAVVVLHAGGDWDWQLPGIVLPAMALAGGALKAMALADGRVSPARPAVRALIAGACVLAMLVVAGPALSDAVARDARDLAVGGDLPAALSRARHAARLAPQDPAPRLLEANILTDLGRPIDADVAFAAAAERSPSNWEIFADWASALAARGDVEAARAAVARARRLNPLEERTRLMAETLAR